MYSIKPKLIYLNINAASFYSAALIPAKGGNLFVKFNLMGKIHNFKHNILASEIPFSPLMLEKN